MCFNKSFLLFILAGLGHNSPEYIRVVSEAMKRATVDKDTRVGDPAFVKVPIDELTGKDYAAELAQAIQRGEKAHVARLEGTPESANTTHVSVIDADGNAVSMTHSLGMPSGVVTDGLATWSGDDGDRQSLIVCGRAHLLEDVKAMEDLERVRHLFEDLDAKKDLIQLLGLAERAEGVRIFIGSENKLFSLSGSALIVSPFEDSEQKIVGVLGVIGPTRLNYARIIPMVDYTARLLGRLAP